MAALHQERAINILVDERLYQDNKHGSIEDVPHAIGGWILLIEAELAEAKQALIKGGRGRDGVMHEIAQIGALALAAIEQHGMNPPLERSL